MEVQCSGSEHPASAQQLRARAPISCHTAPLLTGQPPGSHPRHTTRQHALTSSCHRLPAGGLPLGAGGKPPQTQRKTESTAQSQTKKWGHGPPSRVLQS